MKLVRFGPSGREKPGIIDSQGRIRDLSKVVPDITGEAQLIAVVQPSARAHKQGERQLYLADCEPGVRFWPRGASMK